MVMFSGISFDPLGLPAKGAWENRGAARFGRPVAVFSGTSRTLGKVAGSGGNPTCWLNVKDGNVTLVIVYGGVNGRSNRFTRKSVSRKVARFSNWPNSATW